MDQFVNCGDAVDVEIIDDEYYDVIEKDSGKSAYEILKELNIQSKKFEEAKITIDEDLFDEIVKDELDGE